MATELAAHWERLAAVSQVLVSCDNRGVALANSSLYLEAFGHIIVAWVWLQQRNVADRGEGDFYAGKRQAARYFFKYELPRTAAQLDLLEQLDRTTVEMEERWF